MKAALSPCRAAGLALALFLPWLAPAVVLAADLELLQIGPFTGASGSDAADLSVGIRAAFAQANARGGIGGNKLVLSTADDRYDGAEFTRQFNSAMQRKPLALMSPLGLGAMRALLDGKLLDQQDLVVINAVPGATPFREPGHPRLFHLRASDRQQIEKVLRHSLTLGLTQLQVIVQDRKAGEPDVLGAQKAVPGGDRLKLQIREVPSQAGALRQAAVEIAASAVQGVLVIGSPPYMAEGVAELRKAGMSKMVFALSYVPAGLVVRLAGAEASRGVGITQTFPNPMGQTLPLHREFQAAMKAAAPAEKIYTSFHMEGYLSGRLVVEALKHSSSPVTSTSLAAGLRKMGALDIGGFRVDFSTSNAGSSFVDMAVISPSGRLLY
jgi:ABC-type branched-subunit amino acid transport system substrate-binding protein